MCDIPVTVLHKSKLYEGLACQIKQGDLSQSSTTVVVTGRAAYNRFSQCGRKQFVKS